MDKIKEKLFSFDAETDGLYGEVWAIGAVVFDYIGHELDRFGGQLDPTDLKNKWMRDKQGATCIADVGSPVEASLIRNCVEDDLENRQFSKPYPLHELATMLLAKGIKQDIDRFDFSGASGLIKHNPIDDAYASAMCWL